MPKTTGSHDRLKQLEERIRSLAPLMVSFSGGMDSSFLLWVCTRILPLTDVVAVSFCSPSTPDLEMRDARSLASALNVRHFIYPGPEMQSEDFLKNDLLRCYYCKRERLNFLSSIKELLPGCKIIEGSVTDDLNHDRPGMKALVEAGVISPLLEAGISKADIASIAVEKELVFAGKKSESCLATRIKTGQRIEIPVLEKIQAAEQSLYDMGFEFVRVRWNSGEARLEFLKEDMERAMELRDKIAQSLHQYGITNVALDLEGYKTRKREEKDE